MTVAAIGFVNAGLLSLGQVLRVLFLGTDVLRDAFTGLAADAHRPGYYFSRTKSSGTWHLAAMRVATDAVQLFGAAGISADTPINRYFRDAKVLQIIEGTNQIQRNIIGDSLLGRAAR